MRFLLRFFGLIALAVATIAGTIDSIQSVASSKVVITPLGDAWKNISPSTLDSLQAMVSPTAAGKLAQPVVDWLIAQPTFAIFLAVALLAWMLAYRRMPSPRRFAA